MAGWVEERGKKALAVVQDPQTGQRRSKIFDRKKDARTWISTNDPGLTGLAIQKKVTLNDYVQRVLSSQFDLRDSTRYSYQGTLDRYVRDSIGTQPIATITPAMVRSYFADLRGKINDPSVRGVYVVLSKAFRSAMHEGLVARNPLLGVRMGRAKSRGAIVPMSVDQVQTTVDTINPEWRAAVLLGAYGGLRSGEIGALKSSRVHPKKVEVMDTITRNQGNGWTLGAVKTDASRRTVTLPPFVSKALDAHLEVFGTTSDGRLFRAHSGGLANPNVIGYQWRKAGPAGFKFHDLRHFHASVLINSGANPKIVQSRLGHASVRITLDIYSHLFPNHDSELLEALEELGTNGQTEGDTHDEDDYTI